MHLVAFPTLLDVKVFGDYCRLRGAIRFMEVSRGVDNKYGIAFIMSICSVYVRLLGIFQPIESRFFVWDFTPSLFCAAECFI